MTFAQRSRGNDQLGARLNPTMSRKFDAKKQRLRKDGFHSSEFKLSHLDTANVTTRPVVHIRELSSLCEITHGSAFWNVPFLINVYRT